MSADAVTALRRNRRGDVYHRATCPRIKVATTLPWQWAAGKTRAEVRATSVYGVNPCKTCDPLGALPESVIA